MSLKFCVFCGKNHEAKTKEHVIPRWLISITGDPCREAGFGYDWNGDGSLRKFSFDKFTFPACDDCNNNFSKLENDCKIIVETILLEGRVSAEEWAKIFTWFDKVRIGLWLGYLYLNKRQGEIAPKFHIETRLDTADRTLLIYKTDEKRKGIGIFGVGLLPFDYLPSCFGVRINQFCFINLSTPFLFSRRLGLPYALNFEGRSDRKDRVDLYPGIGYQKRPLLNTIYDKRCVELYQPIVSVINLESTNELYNNEYVRKFLDLNDSRVGKVLVKGKENIELYSELDEHVWCPQEVVNVDCMKLMGVTTYSLQNYLYNELIKVHEFSSFEKGFSKKMIKINNVIIERLKGKRIFLKIQ